MHKFRLKTYASPLANVVVVTEEPIFEKWVKSPPYSQSAIQHKLAFAALASFLWSWHGTATRPQKTLLILRWWMASVYNTEKKTKHNQVAICCRWCSGRRTPKKCLCHFQSKTYVIFFYIQYIEYSARRQKQQMLPSYAWQSFRSFLNRPSSSWKLCL